MTTQAPDPSVELYDTHEHTIDAKGRLVLPSSFREAFADGGFLCHQGDGVGLHTADGWPRWLRRVEQSGELSRDSLRYIIGSASPVTPDNQHRIMVNARLRSSLSLDRDVTIVGQRSHAMIYERSAWNRFAASVVSPPAGQPTLAQELRELSFL
ncbi:MAG: division/cell wall cluster transcriptional repressor MraZ [Actinomycetota bacterium]